MTKRRLSAKGGDKSFKESFDHDEPYTDITINFTETFDA